MAFPDVMYRRDSCREDFTGEDGRGTGPINRVRRRNQQLNCEALESRQLLTGYYIVNADGDALDDPGASPYNFAVIDQWQLNGGANQRWDLVPVGNGNYFIQNEASQLVLDNSRSTIEGSVIDQFQSYGGPNQQWQLDQQPDGTVVIVNAYSQKALEAPQGFGFGADYGVPMIQSQVTGSYNQEWTLVAAGDGTASSDYLQNVHSGNPISSVNKGAPILFDFVPLADGNDLMVDASDFTSGTRVQDVGGVFPSVEFINFSLSQQWYIAPQGNGAFAIENASNYMVLDNGGPNGTLGLHQWYGSQTQEYYLIPGPSGVDIHGQPSNAVVGQPISPAITVAVVDAKGNTVTTNNTQLVTLSIASGPKGAKLLGTTTVRAVNGVADFTNLKLSLAGTLLTP